MIDPNFLVAYGWIVSLVLSVYFINDLRSE